MNDRWLYRYLSKVPRDIHAIFLGAVMFLGVISNEGDDMHPIFFLWCLRANAAAYQELLEKVVKLLINSIYNRKTIRLPTKLCSIS